MSTKDRLWSELTRKNPRLLDDPHFTPSGLRKFFERIYDAGFDAGLRAAKEMPKENDGMNIFREIFR